MTEKLCPACKKQVSEKDGVETDAGLAHSAVCAGYFNAVWPGTRIPLSMPAPLSDDEIIDEMNSAVFDAGPSFHERNKGFAKAVFAAIRAYEKATKAESQKQA